MSADEPGRKWATEPLLDPTNVGKYVWHSYNNNRPHALKVTEVTRQVIRVSGERTSFRPTAPGIARTSESRAYPELIWSNAHDDERIERDDLLQRFHQYRSVGHLSTETLRAIVGLLEGA